MTHSIQTQATHPNTATLPASLKTQTGSPKPDISKSEQPNMVKMKTQPQIKLIAISQLVKSDLNVRKGKVSKSDDNTLYASIMAHGLLQNLIAFPADNLKKHAVVAGGRRLKQLNRLVDNGKLSINDLVPVKVLTAKEAEQFAAELSLSENFIRAKMHPIDEFQAFSKLINDGATISQVAEHFGMTQKFVKQRMKLSNVVAGVLNAYRENKINLDIVMCYSIATQAQQTKIWGESEIQPFCNLDALRRRLTPTSMDESHHLISFVGKKAYKKAGGVTTTDLFEDTTYYEDIELIRTLATAKLDDQVNKLKNEGWKWVKILLEGQYNDTEDYEKITTIKNGETLEYNQEEIKVAGCLISLRSFGDAVTIHKGLVAKEDKKDLIKLQEKNTHEDKRSPIGDDEDMKKESGYSNALNQDLTAQRLIITKYAMMNNSDVAINALHFSICLSVFSSHLTPLYISHRETKCTPVKGELADNKALELIAKTKDSFKLEWVALDTATERFDAFCQLDNTEKQKQVAYAVALSLEPSLKGGSENVECIINKLDVNYADFWRPNTDTFFKRIDQSLLIDIGSPVMSKIWCDKMSKMKKKDVATSLNDLINGIGGHTDKIVSYFKSWMPKGF